MLSRIFFAPDLMYLCYIDKSGTPEVPGNSRHFILAGLSIPIKSWVEADRDISRVLQKHDLADKELHTAWMLRRYLEQSKVPSFDRLNHDDRRRAVQKYRNNELLRLQKIGKGPYQQAKKNYRHTEAYIHLTHAERLAALRDVATVVGNWNYANLFAECIDKSHFDQKRTGRTVGEQAFEQVLSRFHHFLTEKSADTKGIYGLLIHDNNELVAKKHTELMRKFHQNGTLWTKIDRIIETPLFVDSYLTRMVQIADLCAFSLRRFVENGETDLFRIIFKRANWLGDRAVGVRHFAGLACQCEICDAHHRGKWRAQAVGAP